MWSYAFTRPTVKDGRIAGCESVAGKTRTNPRSTAKRLFSRAGKAASRALPPLDIRIYRFLVSLNVLDILLFFSEMSSEMREGASRVGNLSEDDILLSRPFVDRFYRYLSSRHDPPTSVERRRFHPDERCVGVTPRGSIIVDRSLFSTHRPGYSCRVMVSRYG